MPDEKLIRNMFQRNPDGAGFMYLDKNKNKVIIEKGIMDVKTFLKKVKRFGVDDSLVMHFRIGTSGGNTKANTHPFMISENIEDLKKLKAVTDVGVVHNGIIDIMPRKGISDTMEFIADRLAHIKMAMPGFYKNKHILKWVENEIGSKMCFLTEKNEIVTIGDFNENEGVLYSNYTYEESKYKSTAIKPYSYYDYDWDKFSWIDDYDTVDEKVNTLKNDGLLPEIQGRIARLCFVPDDCFILDESDGQIYDSLDYVVDECLNVFGIVNTSFESGYMEVVYNENLQLIKDDDYVKELNFDKLDFDYFYELFM